MTDPPPEEELERTPAGAKAEKRFVGEFEKLLNTYAQTRAVAKGSEERSDTDYQEAFNRLIRPEAYKFLSSENFLYSLGVAVFISGFTIMHNDWEFKIIHIFTGLVLTGLGHHFNKKKYE